MDSLHRFAQAKLDDLERRNLRRALAETYREDAIWVERAGRRLLSFSCTDYLNMSHHPAVKQAATEALARYGAGSGASGLIAGNHPLYAALEERLARIKQTEAAVVFGSGYLANAGIIPVLIERDGLVLLDELPHACIHAGAHLSRGRVMPFRHNNLAHARELLARHRAEHDNALLVTDGMFSMDGDLAPLAALNALADEYDVWLMSDDAHGPAWWAAGASLPLSATAMCPCHCKWAPCRRRSTPTAVTYAPRRW
jgi:8-amino-7-oxononanoate synthase